MAHPSARPATRVSARNALVQWNLTAAHCASQQRTNAFYPRSSGRHGGIPFHVMLLNQLGSQRFARLRWVRRAYPLRGPPPSRGIRRRLLLRVGLRSPGCAANSLRSAIAQLAARSSEGLSYACPARSAFARTVSFRNSAKSRAFLSGGCQLSMWADVVPCPNGWPNAATPGHTGYTGAG